MHLLSVSLYHNFALQNRSTSCGVELVGIHFQQSNMQWTNVRKSMYNKNGLQSKLNVLVCWIWTHTNNHRVLGSWTTRCLVFAMECSWILTYIIVFNGCSIRQTTPPCKLCEVATWWAFYFTLESWQDGWVSISNSWHMIKRVMKKVVLKSVLSRNQTLDFWFKSSVH